jgi:hypothetical protein
LTEVSDIKPGDLRWTASPDPNEAHINPLKLMDLALDKPGI